MNHILLTSNPKNELGSFLSICFSSLRHSFEKDGRKVLFCISAALTAIGNLSGSTGWFPRIPKPMKNVGNPWETLGNLGNPRRIHGKRWETLGNLGKRWETLGNLGKPRESKKNPWKTLGNVGKPWES